MKHNTRSKHVWLMALVISACVLGCNQSSSPQARPDQTIQTVTPETNPQQARNRLVSAEPTSFDAVTARLDPGGAAYLYLSTEQWFAGASETISGWRGLLDVIPDLKPEDRTNLGRAFDFVAHIVRHGGLEEVTGFGFSGIAVEPGVYRTRSLLHHAKGRNAGYLWSVFGRSPHDLDGLDLCPASTAMAVFLDADPPLIWRALQETAARLQIPQVEAGLKQIEAGFAVATGLPLEKVLNSFAGEFGLVLTLDESLPVSIPLPGGGALDLWQPGLMLALKVKDDTLFQRLDELLQMNPQVERVEQNGLRMRVLPIPSQLPVTVRPTLARSGEYLLLGSTDAVVGEAVAVKSGKDKGLKASPSFQRLAAGVPLQGNSFAWISPQFGNAVVQLQHQLLKSAAEKGPEGRIVASLVGKLMAGRTNEFHFTVSANTEEGWLTTSRSTQHPSQIALAPALIAPAIIAGIAMPSFSKARNRAQQVACASNLKQINLAKEMWSADHNKASGAGVSREDLGPYLGSRFPHCPSGGVYTINAIGGKPACSDPGHVLP